MPATAPAAAIPFVPPPTGEWRQRLAPAHLAQRQAREAQVGARSRGTPFWLHSLKRTLPVNSIVNWTIRLLRLYVTARQQYADVQLREVIHRAPRWPRHLDGLRVLQLSDLHLDIDPGLVPAVLAAVRDVSADMTVVTGDFRDSLETPLPVLVRLLRPILAAVPGPVYGILGNHDELELAAGLEGTGLIRMLLNEHVVLPWRGGRFTLAGIDDTSHYEAGDVGAALAGAPPASEAPRLLLAHSPAEAAQANAHDVALTLSGHTHGGQFCLANGHPLFAIDGLPPRLLAGPWREGDTLGYTSRGTGACRVPLRLNCPPEVTLHVLRGA